MSIHLRANLGRGSSLARESEMAMDRFTAPPTDFSVYKERLEALVKRLKDDQFVTVRVDMLRHLFGHEDYFESDE